MAYTQVFTDRKDYLLCITDGKIDSLDALFNWAKSIIDKTRETGHRKLLFDNRTCRLELTSLDVVTFATQLEVIDIMKSGYRLAAIPSPHNPDVSRMVETALINRSVSYKMFASQEAAKEWLFNR